MINNLHAILLKKVLFNCQEFNFRIYVCPMHIYACQKRNLSYQTKRNFDGLKGLARSKYDYNTCFRREKVPPNKKLSTFRDYYLLRFSFSICNIVSACPVCLWGLIFIYIFEIQLCQYLRKVEDQNLMSMLQL